MSRFLTLIGIGLAATLLFSVAEASPLEKHEKHETLEKTPSNLQHPLQQLQSVTLSDRAKYEEELLRKLNTKCSQNDVSSCVMLKLVTYMNKLLKKASIELTDDIEISQKTEQSTNENVATSVNGPKAASFGFGAGRSKDDDTEAFDLVASKLYAFVKSRNIKWRVFPEDDVVVSASEDESGALNLGVSIEKTKNDGARAATADGAAQDGRGKKNSMGPLIAAAVLKIGLIGGLAFKGLALLVGKALLLSKIALLLAGIIGLKKLFSQQKHVTYEVVSHPHHTSSHAYSADHGGHGDSYSSGWARSFHSSSSVPADLQVEPSANQHDLAHNLAYSAHLPVN